MNRLDHNLDHKWHAAINEFAQTVKPWPRFMYEAKAIADEVPRLAMLFEMERNGKLAKVHRQCSHDIEGTPVNDNHLTCVLGTECRNCVFLLALENADVKPAELDQMKAWTCVTHIMTENKDNSIDTSEGFILTTDDMMYWRRLYESMASMAEDDASEEDEE